MHNKDLKHISFYSFLTLFIILLLKSVILNSFTLLDQTILAGMLFLISMNLILIGFIDKTLLWASRKGDGTLTKEQSPPLYWKTMIFYFFMAFVFLAATLYSLILLLLA